MASELVESIADIMTNVEHLETVRKNSKGKPYEEYKELIRHGRVYFTYPLENGDGVGFAPSKFVGYKNNNIGNQWEGDGRETGKKIKKIVGKKVRKLNDIKGEFLNFCYKTGIEEHKIQHKKFWDHFNLFDFDDNTNDDEIIQDSQSNPINLILYGPPGTGKTYRAVDEAVKLCMEGEAKKLTDRDSVMTEFKRLMSEGRIEFVTFHQSFSYEDFVEGLRPTTDKGEASPNNSSGGFSLIPHSGVFSNICNQARDEFFGGSLDSNRRVYQISLTQKTIDPQYLLEHFENSLVSIDLADDIDWTESKFDEISEFKKEWQVKFDRNKPVVQNGMEQSYKFRSELDIGDYVVLANHKKFRFFAFGEVVGPYNFESGESIPPHRREVKWLWKDIRGKSFAEFYPTNFSEKLIIELDTSKIDWESLSQLVSEKLNSIGVENGGRSEFANKILKPLRDNNPRKEGTCGWKSYNVLLNHPDGIKFEDFRREEGRAQDLKWDYDRGRVSVKFDEQDKKDMKNSRKFVLIIDEINRANISKVFGELITLLEKDKRIGEQNEITVRLPYSGQRFGIPPNLYIIGTMNTADRSIALLDKALRRRFKFRELMPDSNLDVIPDIYLNEENVNLKDLFLKINERIEYLYDREYQIGYTYFINCTDIEGVENVFKEEVIPLLAEYFYEDRGKVAEVLGDWPKTRGFSRFEGCFFNATPIFPIGHSSSEPPSNAQIKWRWTVRENFDFKKLNLS